MVRSSRGATLAVVADRAPLNVRPLDAARLAAAKAAYATRRVPRDAMATLVGGAVPPRAGDLVLATVDTVSQHTRIELSNGRRAALFAGDEVVVCYGNRYAPDQFEAVVPDDLGPCALAAAGGIAAKALSGHERMRAATAIQPVGLLGDLHGRPLNLAHWALPMRNLPSQRPYVVAVVGTSMNAGKTTTAAHVIKGLSRAGLRVGAAKVTGTGAGGDVWSMWDAGAAVVLDFTDAGLASTYRVPLARLEAAFATLIAHLSSGDIGAVVLEVADGLYQSETAALLASPVFAASVNEVLFAALDAMGATAGVEWLRGHGLPVSAVGGALTQAPLAAREAAVATGLPVVDLATLADPARSPVIDRIMGGEESACPRRVS